MKPEICKKLIQYENEIENLNFNCLPRDLQNHLAKCSSCLQTFNNLKKINQHLKEKYKIKSEPISGQRLQNILNTIKKHNKYQSKSDLSIFFKLTQLYKYAFAILFFIVILYGAPFFLNSKKSSTITNTQYQIFSSKFNLIDNAKLILPNGRPVNTTPNKIYNTQNHIFTIALNSHKSKITIEKNSIFSLSAKKVYLKSGSLKCILNESHKGFEVKTPSSTVIPLGTNFNISIKKWGTKIVLIKGLLKVINNNSKQQKILTEKGSLYSYINGKLSTYFIPYQNKFQNINRNSNSNPHKSDKSSDKISTSKQADFTSSY